jgi:signal transduction histidine kinase
MVKAEAPASGPGGTVVEAAQEVEERDDDAPFEPLIVGEQVNALYGKGVLPYLVSVVNATLLVAALGRDATLFARGAWLSVICALAAARFAQMKAYHRVQPSPAQAPRWRRRYTVAIACNGVAWGVIPLLFPTPGRVAVHALMSFVLGGMVAGATATASSDQRSFRAFAIPALLPMVLTMALTGGRVNLAMATMLTLFGIAMAILARRAGLSFAQSTRLRLRNERLLLRLADARDLLEGRVLERTAELRATLEEQQRAEARALQAVAARDEFLAVASHELLTPLSALQLQVKVLENDLAPARAQDADRIMAGLTTINRQVARMAALVDTVFRVSGLGRDQLVLEACTIDLAATVQAAISDLEASGNLMSHGSPVTMQLQQPLMGHWDPTRVEQIVMNLLTNALKYGRGGPVTVSLESDPRQTGWVILSISDQGCGIAPTELDSIFEKFHRGEAGRGSRGLGLGLFVVRELVRAMGGRISVSSTVDVGSTFRVWLPEGEA